MARTAWLATLLLLLGSADSRDVELRVLRSRGAGSRQASPSLPPASPHARETQDCVWNKDTDFPAKPPLLLDASFNLVLPVKKGNTREVGVPYGTKLTIACPGEGNSIPGLKQVSAANVTCSGGVKLRHSKTTRNLSELGCFKKVSSSVQQDGRCGANQLGRQYAIGFQIGDQGFYKQISVCFDDTAKTTLYTKHVVRGANIGARDKPSRQEFNTTGVNFTVDMEKVYNSTLQRNRLKDLRVDEDLVKLSFGTQEFFNKGHLAPVADFVTEAEQRATYHYINAVPQWGPFNNGGWKSLENAIRDLADQRGRDLEVYTGGWSVLELDDINGNPVEVYLGLARKQYVVPVPEVMWKVIHDKKNNSAVAVVGVNNPLLQNVVQITKLCPQDLCSSITWINFNTSNFTNGYMYCCNVTGLRAAVPHIPELGGVRLLDGERF